MDKLLSHPNDEDNSSHPIKRANYSMRSNNADGKRIKNFPVAFAPRDFSYDKNKFYVLTEYKIDVYDESGKTINSFDFNRKYVGVERIARYNNSTYLILPSGNSLLVESNNQSVTGEN